MDANLITALAGVLGSVTGASAAIATTWIAQKGQTIRERAKSETRKRETLYGDFITEGSRLVADAWDHSLGRPDTLVKFYAALGRIRLVSSDAVLAAAEECCRRIVDQYAKPNRTIGEIFTEMRGDEPDVFKRFSDLAASSVKNIPLIRQENPPAPRVGWSMNETIDSKSRELSQPLAS